MSMPSQAFTHLPADVKAALDKFDEDCESEAIHPWEPGAPADFGSDPWLSDAVRSHLPVMEQ